MAAKAPPIIDFSGSSSDDDSNRRLIDQVRQACLECGFFQVVNHGIPAELTDGIIKCAEEVFGLPLDVKEQYDKDSDGYNRGYERLRAQNFEKRTQGDLKEGWYFGADRLVSDPDVIARKFGQGPNRWPAEVSDPASFKRTVADYHAAMTALAKRILGLLAHSLDLGPTYFDSFADNHPSAILRLLHYPPQPPNTSDLERGIGAHTDFGAVTILLQDAVGGLQVWSRDTGTGTWIDVVPTPGAFVVNLGNLMMRWTNDRYLSNLHRVINVSGRERYSVPFFFSGNPDYVVECLPSCLDPVTKEVPKYPPITVHEWMTGRYVDTYGKGDGKKMVELSVVEAKEGLDA